MSTRVLVPLANGFEEIEAMNIIDILRRAGADVVTAGITDGVITGRSNVKVTPDVSLDVALDGDLFDMIVLPGGMPASKVLRDDPRIIATIRQMKKSGRRIGAICAAPIALGRAGVLDAEQFTSYPGMEPGLPKEGYKETRVVKSGKIITSRGPGTAMDFALQIVDDLFGSACAASVADELLVKWDKE